MAAHRSNNLEDLAAELARVISARPPALFEPETVVVQSLGMRRWLSLQLAQKLGICIRCEFPFPRTFVEELIAQAVPELAKLPTPLETAWKIHNALPGLLDRGKIFAPVRRYLADGDTLKRFQLAQKIAQVFDQYAVFRPDMISAWENGAPAGRSADEAWQAELWRRISGGRHPAAAAALFKERIASKAADLPARVSFFGISSMPALHLQMLFELSRVCEVHLFLLAPSSEYYGNEETPKQRAKRGAVDQDEPAAVVNPLLLSLGRQSGGATELLLEMDERAGHRLRDGAERFGQFSRAEENLLGVVQADILHARARPSPGAPRFQVAPDDRSIEVHSCYSPMREVEALHDYLLKRFDEDETLQPRDILVLTPDIERYAPYVRSVFKYPENEAHLIPFAIADREARSQSAVMDAFLRILDLAGARCCAADIYSLLEAQPIRKRYAFTDAELELIRGWIEGAGICWGIDGKHRERLDLPAFGANTWRHGLDRLLLGFAMTGGNRLLFQDILPYDEVEGGAAEILGRFVSAVEALFKMVEEAQTRRPLAEWRSLLAGALGSFFLDDADASRDLRALRGALDQLQQIADAAETREPVEFSIVRCQLHALLGEIEQRGRFLTGEVTFCALKSLRGVPARIICLLGMNEESFPRREQALQFDLIARKPQPGDPSPRDDDRHMFLEALVAARERLYLSFIGRSMADNEEIPPSVVLSELFDYLDQSCVFPGEKNCSARGHLLVEHRLQAFSPRYFSQNEPRHRLFSFSAANAAASRSLQGGKVEAPAFFREPVTPAGTEEENGCVIELGALLDFFTSPCRHLVRSVLGIRLEEGEACLPDSEPIELDHLQQFRIRQELVDGRLVHEQAAAPEALAARGVLAPGQLGRRQYRALAREADHFAATVRPHIGDGKKDEPVTLDLRLEGFSLTGRIRSVYGGRLVLHRCSKRKGRDWLHAWIQHVALCAARPENANNSAMFISNDGALTFRPVQDAGGVLCALAGIYRDGLSEPMPFFAESSFAFAEKFLKQNDAQAALAAAHTAWNGDSYRGNGEKEDAYVSFAFSKKAPLADERFQKLAAEVFNPIFAHLQPGSWK